MSAPQQIIMIRHGQSAANVDTGIYNRVPDYRIPLTELGVEQARQAGEKIRRQLDGQQVCVYVSPYLRAYQTLDALGLGDLTERVIEEPRLREQDWANFQIAGDIADQKELRNAYGHFFYRFREGESGSDVYDRISSFMETLYRHWSKPSYAPGNAEIRTLIREEHGKYRLDAPFSQWTQCRETATVLDAPPLHF